jgi:cobalt transporter subunit CbtB
MIEMFADLRSRSDAMATTAPPASAQAGRGSIAAGAVALMFGVVLLAGAGFAGPEALHKAAHDARHAMGFPCH